MDTPEDRIFEFGDFVLNPRERSLLRGVKPVPLTPKAFDLLFFLVRHGGRLTTKNELLQGVWPDTFVEEVNLTVNISALRKALGRDYARNEMIETVAKRGYRFVAPVTTRARVSTTVRSVPITSVAILPFVADGPATEYLADGFTEEMTNSIARLHKLRVAPRSNAFRYKGVSVSLEKVGRELGVDALVTGRVSQHDGQLRAQVDLVDVGAISQIWGAVYEGHPSELIQLQDSVLQDVLRELRIPLSSEQIHQLELQRRATEDADAYRAYLRGRYDWNQRTEDGLRRAIGSFRRAVDLDPGFAAAYSGLADAHAALGYLSYLPPIEAFPAARRHALAALERDPALAEPHASLGYVKLYFDWDWSGAEAEFCRAIALGPSYPVTHQWYGVFLLVVGRKGAALREIRAAQQLDQLSLPINTDLGFCYYYSRQYEEAVKQLSAVLEMNRDFTLAHLWLGRTYQELGQFDEALAAFRRVGEQLRDWPVAIAARGFVEGVAGRRGEAMATLAELERLGRRKFVTSYGIALVHAGLGDSDASLKWLGHAFDERSNWLVWLRLDPRWDRLRSDPRFVRLVGRMRFPPEEGEA